MSKFITFESQETFNLVNAKTWGLEKDKFEGYKLSVIMGDHVDECSKIEDLMKEHGTKSPFYGKSKTLYLKLKNLTQKQKDELLDKKMQNIHEVFKVTGLCENNNGKFLMFKVTGLRRLELTEKEEECPSDLDNLYKNKRGGASCSSRKPKYFGIDDRTDYSDRGFMSF